MSKCIYQKPENPAFLRDGLAGYNFGVANKNLEIYFVDSKTGHGRRAISDSITHLYYILDGSGEFEIDGKTYPAHTGELVEIPPKHSFDYSGSMKMLLIMEPPYSPEKVIETN